MRRALLVIGFLAAGAWLTNRLVSSSPSPEPSAVLGAVLQKSVDHPGPFVKPGVLPPTNKWFSSVAFAQPSQPIFAYPLSYKTTVTGFELSYPQAHATRDAIFAPHTPDVRVDLGASSTQVAEYDDLSVVVEHRNHQQQAMARSRVTHGSPFVFMTISQPATISVPSASIAQVKPGLLRFRLANKMYGLAYDKSVMASWRTAKPVVHLQPTSATSVSLFVWPTKVPLRYLEEAARAPITQTTTSYRYEGNKVFTDFTVVSEHNRRTLLALLPHQYEAGANNQRPLGTFTTLYGQQRLLFGRSFSYALPAPLPPTGLAYKRLDPEEREQLTRLVARDTTSLKFEAVDTYFSGKELYRAANLLELAAVLQLREQATLQQRLKEQLQQWLEEDGYQKRASKYFYYDDVVHGLVGVVPSFGSEQFNDHHFHYGYLIYAASILARYDPAFREAARPMVERIISDIASANATPEWPRLRNFDPYTGHSWASGYGTFGDGNNQESSSEAVTAWYAIYLWSQTVQDEPLAQRSRWLLAHEQQAALRYWLNIDTRQSQFRGYGHTIISLVWGGKRDYATFFSPKPEAKLGIQLIPMSPAQGYLGADKRRVIRNLQEFREELKWQEPTQFTDYIRMYESLANPAIADQPLTLTQEQIDSANTPSYVYAWIHAQQ